MVDDFDPKHRVDDYDEAFDLLHSLDTASATGFDALLPSRHPRWRVALGVLWTGLVLVTWLVGLPTVAPPLPAPSCLGIAPTHENRCIPVTQIPSAGTVEEIYRLFRISASNPQWRPAYFGASSRHTATAIEHAELRSPRNIATRPNGELWTGLLELTEAFHRIAQARRTDPKGDEATLEQLDQIARAHLLARDGPDDAPFSRTETRKARRELGLLTSEEALDVAQQSVQFEQQIAQYNHERFLREAQARTAIDSTNALTVLRFSALGLWILGLIWAIQPRTLHLARAGQTLRIGDHILDLDDDWRARADDDKIHLARPGRPGITLLISDRSPEELRVLAWLLTSPMLLDPAREQQDRPPWRANRARASEAL